MTITNLDKSLHVSLLLLKIPHWKPSRLELYTLIQFPLFSPCSVAVNIRYSTTDAWSPVPVLWNYLPRDILSLGLSSFVLQFDALMTAVIETTCALLCEVCALRNKLGNCEPMPHSNTERKKFRKMHLKHDITLVLLFCRLHHNSQLSVRLPPTCFSQITCRRKSSKDKKFSALRRNTEREIETFSLKVCALPPACFSQIMCRWRSSKDKKFSALRQNTERERQRERETGTFSLKVYAQVCQRNLYNGTFLPNDASFLRHNIGNVIDFSYSKIWAEECLNNLNNHDFLPNDVS
jgi:hypothetical protein